MVLLYYGIRYLKGLNVKRHLGMQIPADYNSSVRMDCYSYILDYGIEIIEINLK